MSIKRPNIALVSVLAILDENLMRYVEKVKAAGLFAPTAFRSWFVQANPSPGMVCRTQSRPSLRNITQVCSLCKSSPIWVLTAWPFPERKKGNLGFRCAYSFPSLYDARQPRETVRSGKCASGMTTRLKLFVDRPKKLSGSGDLECRRAFTGQRELSMRGLGPSHRRGLAVGFSTHIGRQKGLELCLEFTTPEKLPVECVQNRFAALG